MDTLRKGEMKNKKAGCRLLTELAADSITIAFV